MLTMLKTCMICKVAFLYWDIVTFCFIDDESHQSSFPYLIVKFTLKLLTKVLSGPWGRWRWGGEGDNFITYLMIMTPTPIVKPWIQDLIEMTMKKMDEDKDGKVSFADFEVDIVIVVFVDVLVVVVIINNKNHNKNISQKQSITTKHETGYCEKWAFNAWSLWTMSANIKGTIAFFHNCFNIFSTIVALNLGLTYMFHTCAALSFQAGEFFTDISS